MDKKLTFISVCISLAIFFQNCARAEFSSDAGLIKSRPDSDEVGLFIPGQSCSNVLNSTSVPVTTLFMVDRSSSNKSTDPSQRFRSTSLRGFFDEYKSHMNFSWGLSGFDRTSMAFVNTGTPTAAKITASSLEMSNAIDAFFTLGDGDGTNYKAAMDSLVSLVQGDRTNSGNRAYIIVFLSDGRPNMGYEANGDHLTAAGQEDLLGDIRRLVSIYPTQITFNTFYYGPKDDQASNLMLKMAIAGQGRFLDVNVQGSNFPVADVVRFPGGQCSGQ